MHASGKILCGIGLVLVLIGGGMFAWGSMTIDDSVDDLEDNYWVLEGVTSGTVEIVDDDGAGEIGFSIFIEGTLVDADEDGVWDHCDSYDYDEDPSTDFNVTHTDDADNSFWYACDTEWNNNNDLSDMERTEGSKTLVKIGDAAYDYNNGTATVSCAAACWVQYDDKAFGEALGDLGGIFGGALAAMGSTCFFGLGCCFLVFGLIFGLTINDKSQTIIVQGGGGGQMVGTPVVAAGGAVPVMGAPMAAPVAAAPVAAPDPAQEYYSSLLAQGYDAQSASQYTSQHYPGFQG
jgi:hypothetical protein